MSEINRTPPAASHRAPYQTKLPYPHFNKHRGTLRIIYHADGTKTTINLMAQPLPGIRKDPLFLKKAKKHLDDHKGSLDFPYHPINHMC